MITIPPKCFQFLHLIIIFEIIFFCLKASTNAALAFTNVTDQESLLHIKDQITGDPFNALKTWNHSLHFCKWKGITCSPQHQRVTALDLSSQQLVGSLSPQIGNLTFLKTIYLQNNSFHGKIPQEITKLFRLQHFSLENNSFQGEVPANLSQYSNLIELNMIGNDLIGKIPSDIGLLSNLELLYLSENHLTGEIPPSLGNLTSVRAFSLDANDLVGNIPSTLSLLSNLEFFQLSFNKLSGNIPWSLFNISSIKLISLTDNQLEGNLPPDLGFTLPNLEAFFIPMNRFSGLVPPLTNASKLAFFDIGSNNFTGPLPINFGGLQNLEVLDLAANQFVIKQPNELDTLIKSLVNCTYLRFLQLQSNGMKGDLPDSIANLSSSLNLLAIVSSDISGTIPQEIGNLVNLQTLALDGNTLEGIIPDSIGKLRVLEGLFLDSNNISGEIPASIGNITHLSLLGLHKNKLFGSIPITLANCRNLQGIDFQDNRLTGVIPDQILGLNSLTNLNLKQNQFTGPLPSDMGILKNLGHLDISRNKLTGKIPSTLGDCLMLENLYLQDNFLEGIIPTSFKQLKSLQVLDLSHNNFSGVIPSFLGELPLIQNLNLSNNLFEGEVPTTGVFKNTTTFSVTGNSHLCGGISELGLLSCPKKVSKKKRKHTLQRITPLLVILPTVSLVCFLTILFYVKKSKRQKSSAVPSLLGDKHPKLSYAELLDATNGFSSNNLVGEGRYGSVYSGVLNSSELTVAVKVLKVELRGATKSFLAECETLGSIRHRNLVKIITSCSSVDFKGNDFKALVIEFMPNGSLESWIHSIHQSNGKALSLLQRLNIAIDVASALDYLHHHCQPRIIHCDIKPSNILLDDELCAHLGDFGLARFLLATSSETNHTRTSLTGIRGTIGYVPPEYGMGGEASPEGDIYSYGILLLEIFTGKGPTDVVFTDTNSLYNYVKVALPDHVMEIVDLQILLEENEGSDDSINKSEKSSMIKFLASILSVGVLCSSAIPSERVDISYVLMELARIRNAYLRIQQCVTSEDNLIEGGGLVGKWRFGR